MRVQSLRSLFALRPSLSASLSAIALLGSIACTQDATTTPEPTPTPTPAPAIRLLAGSSGGPGTLDGQGRSARFAFPTGLARDASGNFFITDATVGTVRKVTPDWNVTTYAGAPNELRHADGTLATARFIDPNAIVMDATGNLFVTDAASHVIRKIGANGTVTTFAGKAGEAGHADGAGTNARFFSPDGIAIDGAGNLYVVDSEVSVIRKITPNGTVSTYAGHPEEIGAEDGDRVEARFMFPKSIHSDAEGNLWVSDAGNHTIRHVTKNGVVSTLAGNAGLSGMDDGAGTEATFNNPRGLATDSAGNVYVADGGNNAIRKITPAGVVTTVVGDAGMGGEADGALAQARMSFPMALLAVESGSSLDLYVCDGANSTLRKISLSTGQVTTLVGTAPAYGATDGLGSAATFFGLAGIITDADGNLVVADENNHTLRKITPEGNVFTWVGAAGQPGIDEGTDVNARLSNPLQMAKDSSGNVFVTSVWGHRIQKITPTGETTVYAGSDIFRGNDYVDGPRLEAKFSGPTGIAIDSKDHLYFVDSQNFLIRGIDPDGEVTTIAGAEDSPGFRDGPGDLARFFNTYALAVDAQDNIWVADTGNHSIRRIAKENGTWMVTTIAGGPVTLEETPAVPGYRDGKGSDARFSYPRGLLFDTDGSLLVADFGNSLIRRVTPDGTVTTVVGTPGRFGYQEGGLPGTILEPMGLAWLAPKQLAVSFSTGVLSVQLP